MEAFLPFMLKRTITVSLSLSLSLSYLNIREQTQTRAYTRCSFIKCQTTIKYRFTQPLALISIKKSIPSQRSQLIIYGLIKK